MRYLVATLAAKRPEGDERRQAPPTHLALVIDASGSMSGDKLDNAKKAALGVIARMKASDRISVVSFAEEPIVHVRSQAPVGEALVGLRAAIAALTTRGNTNLSEGWFTGAECVAGDSAAVRRVIPLSDGAANTGVIDPQTLAEHAAHLAKGGVATSCVGVGDGYDIPVLQQVAEHGDGRLHDAETGAEIVEALVGELNEIADLTAREATLTPHVPANIKAALVGSAPTYVSAGALSVSLGSLVARTPRTCVFRLTLPAGRIGETLLVSLSARAATLDGGETRSGLVDASFTLVEGARNYKQQRDVAASLAVALAWQAEIIRRAARLNRSGERRKARSFVERQWSFFERYCARLGGAEALLREIALLKRNVEREWDERTRKEMEFSAYRAQTSKADYRAAPRASWAERLEGKD